MRKVVGFFATVLVVVIAGGAIYTGFKERRVVGKVVGTRWECWSCSHIPNKSGIGYHGKDLDNTQNGTGRMAYCSAANNAQVITFTIMVDSPLGTKEAGYKWRWYGDSATRDFQLPMNFPPDGSEVRIKTTRFGTGAELLDLRSQ
ncbi:MAG: hypothetical protein A3A33_00045 [Candidatus Yanofskybacteria bacterium RIFCSPLOWO2_01_FULL_49_25]|uniref:Uncharacterized protein n=1 Tax=Candidatus Yanofskybacteria bacterium RIFCSPLOWO2_01_FULL_49_25 TaxID=1802701 RepID=A0A1F8GUE6_9BACT|nr:MAG: hypothetical protein A3A33_00045 [Candidatus Yanofskybacteria bacterium RIFCSPLOWO2_01_FULL_49_25]